MPLPKIIQIPLGDAAHLQYYFKQIEVSSAEILTLFSAPTTLVTAPGAGHILMPIHSIIKYNFVTTAYGNVNDDPQIKVQGATDYIMVFPNLLSQAADFRMFRAIREINIDQPENAGIILTEDVDPNLGDSTLTVYLWYINLEL